MDESNSLDVRAFAPTPRGRKVTIARANATIISFQIHANWSYELCYVALGGSIHECSCSPCQIHKYLSNIRPLMDRIDLQLEVAPVKFSDLEGPATTDSMTIKKRVEAARLMQLKDIEHKIHCNSQLTPNLINKHCKLINRKASMKEVSQHETYCSCS